VVAVLDLEPDRIVRLEDDAVVVLDQRRLPDEVVELRCTDAAELAEAIRSLAVRGAPAIGVAALDEMRADPTPDRARRIHEDEVARCVAMGAHAAELVPPAARILTHCNAGGLATGGYGSAVGAIRAAAERGGVSYVWVDETRPLLQGARLTAFELEVVGIPHAVIVDSAAASRMAAGEVDIVITGADRIAANGDSANKIGTYGLAVLAHYHQIPFVIVAPTSTIDQATPTGAAIPIEERDPAEVTPRFPARNPAFDVTPANLIAAIVTEAGIHRAPYAESLPAPVSSR
jgi:methylthioribose-1-phosphate isomerase